MSLLQDVLRSTADAAAIERRLTNLSLSQRPNSHSNVEKDDDDDELVNVVSLAGTPAGTRPSSPTRSSARGIRGPWHISGPKQDPLRALTTEISQRIFALLSIKDLSNCALVCKKWNRSQTLNYVWFQHYRKDNFHDDSVPSGKWTKRESKQNWRLMHLLSPNHRSPTSTSGWSRAASGYASPSSGYQTPREIKEEKWRQEAEASAKPGKLEMREMYKELGGRKSRTKGKLGSSGVRDKGGWNESEW